MPGWYRIISVKLHTTTIEEDLIPNPDSIDCLFLSRSREQVIDKPYKTTNTTQPQNEIQQRRSAVKDAEEVTKDDIIVAEEYVVSRVMRGVDTSKGKRYVVSRNGYRRRYLGNISPHTHALH